MSGARRQDPETVTIWPGQEEQIAAAVPEFARLIARRLAKRDHEEFLRQNRPGRGKRTGNGRTIEGNEKCD